VEYALQPWRKRGILAAGTLLALRSLPTLFLIQLAVIGPVEVVLGWLHQLALASGPLAQPLLLAGSALRHLASWAAVGLSLLAVTGLFLDARPGFRAQLRFAATRALPLLWTNLVYLARIVLGLVCLVLPGVLQFLRGFFVQQVVVVEGLSGAAALRRSRELWGAARGRILALLLLSLLLQQLAHGLFLALGDFRLNELLGAALAGSLQAGVVTIAYLDLRVREGGFDAQVLAQALGTAPQARR
jgi:hypothetical protein